MKSFWIVCNFETSHWKMRDARKFDTEAEAIEYAEELSRKYGATQPQYHVLKTTHVVMRAEIPIEVIPLK